MKKITIIFLVVISALSVCAQKENVDTLFIYTKYTNQGVMIKMAPQMAQTWLKGAEHGYDIYRSELDTDKDPIRINENPIKPFTDAEYAHLENGDTLKEFHQMAIFDNIAKNKSSMSVMGKIQFIDKLQNDYGFYYLVATRIRDVAMTSGLEYIDKTAKSNKVYVYTVKIADDNNRSHSSTSIINTDIDKIILPELVSTPGDNAVDFSWIHRGGSEPILCYYLEKSEDGINFIKVSEYPYYYNPKSRYELDDTTDVRKLIYQNDSLSENYKLFYYRLVGLDAWAIEHPSKEVIKVMGVDKTPPPPVKLIESNHNIVEKSISYKWEYTGPADFAGFKLYASHKLKGQYKAVNDSMLSVHTKEFTLKNVPEGKPIFFRIVTFDTTGNYSFADSKLAMLPDLYPPSTPTNFKGTIDTNGILLLNWKANAEQDIKGYRVLAANSKREQLISITGLVIRDTFYIDDVNLSSLSKFKYFKLEAVDNNFNTSDQTDYITLSLPDKIKPSSGIIIRAESKDGTIRLDWIKSTSDDLISQEIWRQSIEDKEWKVVATVSKKDTSFTDHFSKQGMYEYCIRTKDVAGNISEFSNAFRVQVESKVSAIAISDFKAKKKNGNAILTWNTNGDKPKFYIIYREDKGGNIRAIASITKTSFIDTQVSKGNSYKYYVVAQDKNGGLHKSSKVEKVNF